MGWRRWNHILHRDIGFFCIGLTVIYAISGIAVNHTSHGFNPSYTIEKSEKTVSPIQQGTQANKNYVEGVLKQLQIDEKLKNTAMLSPVAIRIFTTSNTIDVQLVSGKATIEKIERRALLFESNYLHLNKAKGVWTWIADLYGVALLLLALSGLLMIRGRIKVRGLVLTFVGILLPIAYLIFAA